MFVGFFNGFATGASVIVANAIGAQDEDRTKKAVYTTATFGIILGLIMTVSVYVLTDQMLIWMGLPKEVFGLSSTYLKIYFLGGFSLVLYNMLVGIIRAGGDAKHPLYYYDYHFLLTFGNDRSEGKKNLMQEKSMSW